MHRAFNELLWDNADRFYGRFLFSTRAFFKRLPATLNLVSSMAANSALQVLVIFAAILGDN